MNDMSHLFSFRFGTIGVTCLRGNRSQMNREERGDKQVLREHREYNISHRSGQRDRLTNSSPALAKDLEATCTRWPTPWDGTPHTARSSTSGTCSCSARCESFSGCCVHGRSTVSRSCRCCGWFCCISVLVYLQSPPISWAHRNLGTSQSTPALWTCFDGVRRWAPQCSHSHHFLFAGWKPHCSYSESWQEWPTGTSPLARSPRGGTLVTRANRS